MESCEDIQPSSASQETTNDTAPRKQEQQGQENDFDPLYTSQDSFSQQSASDPTSQHPLRQKRRRTRSVNGIS